MQKQTRRCKEKDRIRKLFFKELPYYNFTGNSTLYHGQFNNSLIQNQLPTKRQLENPNGLHDLGLFRLKSNLDGSLNTNNLFNQQIYTRYYSPNNFNKKLNSRTKDDMETCFSIFHNNIISLNHNLERLQTNYLTEIDFQFDIIGLTETKITKTTCNLSFEIPGYTFQYVATRLASGGVARLFINEDLNLTVLERVSYEAFQALWIEISHEKQKMLYVA